MSDKVAGPRSVFTLGFTILVSMGSQNCGEEVNSTEINTQRENPEALYFNFDVNRQKRRKRQKRLGAVTNTQQNQTTTQFPGNIELRDCSIYGDSCDECKSRAKDEEELRSCLIEQQKIEQDEESLCSSYNGQDFHGCEFCVGKYGVTQSKERLDRCIEIEQLKERLCSPFDGQDVNRCKFCVGKYGVTHASNEKLLSCIKSQRPSEEFVERLEKVEAGCEEQFDSAENKEFWFAWCVFEEMELTIPPPEDVGGVRGKAGKTTGVSFGRNKKRISRTEFSAR